MITYPAVPYVLKDMPNWVVWKYETRDGKETKVPYDAKSNGDRAYAKVNDSATWATFDRAAEVADILSGHDYNGVGFVFTDALQGADLDGVVQIVHDVAVVDPFALAIAKLANTYAEYSPSGSGVHLIWQSAIPLPPGNRAGSKKLGGELYDKNSPRYFTVTGDKVPEVSADAIAKIEDPGTVKLLHFLVLNIHNAKLTKLWLGKWKETTDSKGKPFPSQSEADLALCNALVRSGFNSFEKLDGAFRQSGLMRPEWEHKGKYTISKTLGHRFLFVEASSNPSNTGDYTRVGESRKVEHPIIQASRESAEKFDMDSILFDPAMKHAEHEPIFQGFLTVGDSALVIGAKKAEKSLFGLRWAMHIACGKTWCGFTCTRPRRVAYLDGENDSRDVSDRYNSLLGEFSPEEQQLIRQNLAVIWGRPYTEAGGSLDYLNDRWWDGYAKQTKDCEVHFLDCLYLFHDKESYDNNGLRKVMDVLRYRINSMGPERTVVMLHHSRSMSNDDLRSVDKLSLERLGPINFSETSFGGKVLLKNATLVVCLDKQSKRDEDGEIESQDVYFQFYGRRVPESPLLRFEAADEKFARRLVRALSKGVRKSVMNLRMARGDSGSWGSKDEAAKDLKCARSNAYRHLEDMIAKEYLVLDGGRYHLRLTAELNIEITRAEEHNAAHDAATKWLRQYVTYPMKAENVIEAGDEEGHGREDLIEARPDSGLIEETVTDAGMVSTLMWRPKKKRGAFKKDSALAKQAAEKRWTKPEEQAELPMATSDPGADGSPAVEVDY